MPAISFLKQLQDMGIDTSGRSEEKSQALLRKLSTWPESFSVRLNNVFHDEEEKRRIRAKKLLNLPKAA